MLTRPIGQVALAKTVADLIHDGIDKNEIFSKLKKADEKGMFSAHSPSTVWYGVTFDPVRRAMITRSDNQELAARLLRYLLQGMKEEERTRLTQDVMEARKTEED